MELSSDPWRGTTVKIPISQALGFFVFRKTELVFKAESGRSSYGPGNPGCNALSVLAGPTEDMDIVVA